MRLIDRIRLADARWAEWWPDLPVITADQIQAQIDAMPDIGTVPWHAYGTVAPPFDHFFVENTAPAFGEPAQRGAFCAVIPADHITPAYAGPDRTIAELPPRKPNARWRLAVTAWAYFRGELWQSEASAFIDIAADGLLLEDPEHIRVVTNAGRRLRSPGPAEASGQILPFVLFTLSAMHRRAEAEHVTPTRQARRRFARDHKTELPPADYWILHVKDQPISSPADIGQPPTGPRRRRPRDHTVRGHFRYYTEAAPLFGRVTGMVWVPEHSRGDDAAGHIRKDYQIDRKLRP